MTEDLGQRGALQKRFMSRVGEDHTCRPQGSGVMADDDLNALRRLSAVICHHSRTSNQQDPSAYR